MGGNVMCLLKIANIKKQYEGLKVLDGVSFTIESGVIYGLLGGNGMGKTTLLQIISGLLDFDEGTILINGIDLKLNRGEANKMLGYVPDQPFLYEYLTGVEYLEFIGSLWNVHNAKKRILELLSLFKLEGKANSLITTYSFGMKQKLATAGALLPKPKVIVLDEPFTGFDPPSAKLMKDFFKNYVEQGNSVLFSTHIVDVAKNFCDRVGILNDGKIVQEISNPRNMDHFEGEIIKLISEKVS
jgi:ABC-2 type transport system ATP-binding protein